MENLPLRYGQVHHELIVSSANRAEILCPEPRRPKRIPFLLEGYGRISPKPKSILPVSRRESALDVLDTILNKEEYDENDLDSSNQVSFFCGSPPSRTSNPVVNDAQFVKQTLSAVASPSEFHYDMKPRARSKRGSPTCGSSLDVNPKLRIEGFACRSPAFA
ncbi:hypothetical protein J5N97_016581 [Dioscorea zingiberensis]|uniref:Uncharacterized protein n=1 Tax=Dioscorea zingiberensis TaxID=325984 RepID=A0A9D5CJN3_9LILI|nr:hypothetical protein J5N97_016581 [Dioscorea zingiberensis]